MLDLGLPDRIRAKGVKVVLVAGWETRSAGSFNPQGAVDHHTAGPASGILPSLATLTFGRQGSSPLPGPLCNVAQSREAGAGNDQAYVIAAGRANHAGSGGWRGLSGNSSVGGLEIEHTGLFPLPDHRIETACRITAALLEAPGAKRDAAYSCQHFEWAPDRKIDVATQTVPSRWRARVAFWIGRTVEEDPLMALTDAQQLELLNNSRDAISRLKSLQSAMPLRVVRTGFKTGDPVYVTDLASYIFQVEQNGPFDTMVQNLKTLAHLDPKALRVDQAVIDDMLESLPSARD